MTSEDLLRKYLDDHNRCSSKDNLNGRFCNCSLCEKTRIFLKHHKQVLITEIRPCVFCLKNVPWTQLPGGSWQSNRHVCVDGKSSSNLVIGKTEKGRRKVIASAVPSRGGSQGIGAGMPKK